MSVTILVLAAAIMAAPANPAEAREQRLWELAKNHDMAAFKDMLDPDFVAVYAGATNDAAAEVTAIERQQLQSFSFVDFKVRQLAAGLELVTYEADARGTFDGADISGRYRVTSIWKQAGSEWKLAYHSEIKAL